MSENCKNEGKNVVQVEFFHSAVDSTAPTLEEALVELSGSMGRLIAAGKPIKTAVRFYDEHGHITELVKKYMAALKIHYEAVLGLAEAGMGSPEQSSCEIDLHQSSHKMDKLRGQAKSLIPGQLSAIMKGSKQIAVELRDHNFRAAEESEFPQLLDNARKAKDMWIFVFTPADLLKVDGLTSVGNITRR